MSDDPTVVRALHQLQDNLTMLIDSRLATVHTEIAKLSQAHSHALLDQERRNSSFADRDRVETIATNVHDVRSIITGNMAKIHSLEKQHTEILATVQKHYDDLCHKMDSVQHNQESRSYSSLSNITGYIVTALILLAIALVTYFLSHGH